MKPSCACHTETGISKSKPTNAAGPVTFVQRVKRLFKVLIPGITLLLMPKCPVCFAAYFAIGTGITLSVTTATYLRAGLVVLCIGVFAWVAFRMLWPKRI